MVDKPVYLTPDGLARTTEELEQMRSVRRPEVLERLQRAKEQGGTEDNAEYDDAKNDQAFVEGRILEFENNIKNASLIKPEPGGAGIVRLGSTVNLLNSDGEKEEYTIVGSAEADPARGRISNESPVGKAVLGRLPGDQVEVLTPVGVLQLTVVDIL